MTTIRCGRRGRTFEVSIAGHAQYAKQGEPDIVCAAVSALACTLLRRMAALRADGMVEALNYRRNAGDVWLLARAKKGGEAQVRAAVDTVLTGLSLIAEGYPGHVRVTEM